MKITDVKMGMLVCGGGSKTEFDRKFIGTVTGFTVNSLGEVIVLLDSVSRASRETTPEIMAESGMTYEAHTYGAFIREKRIIHPSALVPFVNPAYLMEQT